MTLREKTILELENLSTEDLLRVHELILRLKRSSGPVQGTAPLRDYEEVQRLLLSCPGSLAEDVRHDRDERG